MPKTLIDYNDFKPLVPQKKLLDTSIQWCDQCQENKEHDVRDDGDWEIYTCRCCGRNWNVRVG